MERIDSRWAHRFGLGILAIALSVMSTSLFAADTVPPTAPASLNGVAAASGTQIDLTWGASTDNVGVTAYLLERCKGTGCTNFAQIVSVTGTSYSNTGLTVATDYSYRVRARDAANNKSAYSPVATITTPPDTIAPSVPTGLGISVVSNTNLTVTWTASTDNVKATGYLVERCLGSGCTNFAQVATPTTTTYNNTGLTPNSSYSYRVRAKDAAGNLSGYSSVVTASTPPDTQAPTAPSGLAATVASSTKITLSWTASTDDVKVTGYQVERCSGAGCTNFAQVGTSTGASFSNTGLTAGSAYSYRVRATDAAGNLSGYSSTVSATTSGADVTAPSAPSSLSAIASSSTEVDLNWSASTDNQAVTGYRIERCQGASCSTFAQIVTSTGPSFSDTTVVASTTYKYRVRAKDAANNLSPYSNTASATTSSADTQPPTTPTGLTATAVSSTQINVSWGLSTDNVGVTGYLLERCQNSGCTNYAQIASTLNLSFSDTGLTPATNYAYRVRAQDAVPNFSPYSNVANSATQYSGPITYSYTYDALGRLKHASGSDGSQVDYQYDENGNVKAITR